MMMHQSFHF